MLQRLNYPTCWAVHDVSDLASLAEFLGASHYGGHMAWLGQARSNASYGRGVVSQLGLLDGLLGTRCRRRLPPESLGHQGPSNTYTSRSAQDALPLQLPP